MATAEILVHACRAQMRCDPINTSRYMSAMQTLAASSDIFGSDDQRVLQAYCSTFQRDGVPTLGRFISVSHIYVLCDAYTAIFTFY